MRYLHSRKIIKYTRITIRIRFITLLARIAIHCSMKITMKISIN